MTQFTWGCIYTANDNIASQFFEYSIAYIIVKINSEVNKHFYWGPLYNTHYKLLLSAQQYWAIHIMYTHAGSRCYITNTLLKVGGQLLKS